MIAENGTWVGFVGSLGCSTHGHTMLPTWNRTNGPRRTSIQDHEPVSMVIPGITLASARPRTHLRAIRKIESYPFHYRAASTWSPIRGLLRRFGNQPEASLSLPTTGFDLIDKDTRIEEEELPNYVADRFYPMRLGQVFQEQYQIIAKLGFGSSSTIWLARDLLYAPAFLKSDFLDTNIE